MGTGLGCILCGNNFGEIEFRLQIGKKLRIVYICAICAEDKSEDELFKLICIKGVR